MHKGPQLALSRWMSWHHCSSYWERPNGIRLLALLYLGLDLGYLTPSEQGSSVQLQPATSSAAQGPQASTKDSATRQVRDKCNNLLHVATVVLSDEDTLRKGSILQAMYKGLRDWQSVQVTASRDALANAAFDREQAAWGFLGVHGCRPPLPQ